MIGPLFSQSNDLPPYFHIPFGSVFFLVGSAFIFGRYRIQVDKNEAQITQQWSLLFPLRTKKQALRGIKEIRITHELRKSKNSTYSVYPVALSFEGQEAISFESPRSPHKSRKLGEQLAKFLQIPLTDASQGSVSTRQHNELDLNLKQRLQSGSLRADIPQPPDRLKSRIDFDGTRLKVEIPPAGPQLPLLIGLIPILGFMGFAGFIVSGPILQDQNELPLPVLLFMIVFFSIPGSIALGLIGRMFFFRQTLLADSSVVSHSRGWLFRRLTTIPAEQVEEILLGRPGKSLPTPLALKGQSLLIQSDAKSITVSNHLPHQEADYILSLLRAVIAS